MSTALIPSMRRSRVPGRTLRPLLWALMLLHSPSFAQVPQAFGFQGMARDLSGNPLVSRPISLRFGIVAGTSAGPIEYQETQAATTSPLGLFTVQVGNGTVIQGAFSTIGWTAGPRFLKVEMDPAGGTSYQLIGTTQMWSVPYALVAGSVPCATVSLLGDTLHESPGRYMIIPGISLANGGCADTDADGFYNLAGCSNPPDCNDNDAAVHPGATELCDGADNDCDGTVDEGFDLLSDPLNCGDCGISCDDGIACTNDVCQAGVCAHTSQPGTCLIAGVCYPDGTLRPDFPCQSCNSSMNATDWTNSPSGTSCATGTCDGNGACTECTVVANCPGTDTECRTRTCVDGVCGFSYAAVGTLVGSQTAGDCQRLECDGSGGIISVDDNTDVFVDGLQCTNDVCVGGVPSNPPVIAGTPCNQGGGTVCNGAGVCTP